MNGQLLVNRTNKKFEINNQSNKINSTVKYIFFINMFDCIVFNSFK